MTTAESRRVDRAARMKSCASTMATRGKSAKATCLRRQRMPAFAAFIPP